MLRRDYLGERTSATIFFGQGAAQLGVIDIDVMGQRIGQRFMHVDCYSNPQMTWEHFQKAYDWLRQATTPLFRSTSASMNRP
jgi:hypothetical protein